MKTNYLKLVSCGVAILVMSCSTVDSESTETDQNNLEAVFGTANKGATQISGIGYLASDDDTDEYYCDSSGQGALFALFLTGDLEGCLFVYPETSDCSPSGTYRESGTEMFVAANEEEDTFMTAYKFEAKYEECNDDGTFGGAEIFGRCQHPITMGSGTGIFAGVTGRLDFKDDVETGEFPYRGHLK